MSRLGLALIPIVVAGCFSEPGRPGARDGGGDDVDAYTGPLAVHLINIASGYEEPGSGSFRASPGSSRTGWQLSEDGVRDGQLLVIIGNIDNGSATFYNSATNPFPEGWDVVEKHIVQPDGQSIVVATRVANGEPAFISGTYEEGTHTSGAMTMALLAVDGADTSMAPVQQLISTGSDQDAEAFGTTTGITTVAPGSLLIYASGVDWAQALGNATFHPPTNFAPLVTMTSEEYIHPGSPEYIWTTEMIATKFQDDAGPTHTIQGSTASDGTEIHMGTTVITHGVAWVSLLAIAPAR